MGAAAGEGTGARRRVGARHATRRHRLVAGRGRRRGAGIGVRVPARRRSRSAARSAVALAAQRRARRVARPRPGRPPVGRRRVDRAAPARQRALRVPHRHVHPGGHVRRGDREARPPRRARHRHRRGAAGQRRGRAAELGLRRRRLVRGHGELRRAGRVQAVRRGLPRPRPRRVPGRGLQPPRPLRAPTWTGSARTSPAATSGVPPSTSTGRSRRSCAASSSTTP